MKAIVIDDIDNANFAGKVLQEVNSDLQLLVTTKDPREVAQDIFEYLDDPEVKNVAGELVHIVINVEGKFGGAHHQDQRGVDILLWIRCKNKISNPVILYGFQSNQQLLKKKPSHLIINSEGSYFVQLPYDFKGLANSNLSGVKNFGALQKYLEPAFEIEKFRHREANWWGVKRLWDIHKIKTAGGFKEEYPPQVKKSLEVLNNVIADFCYGMRVERIEDYTQKCKDDLTKQLDSLQEELRNAETQKVVVTENIGFWQSFLTSILEKVENLKRNFLRYFANTSREYAEIKAEIQTHEGDVGEAKDALEETERQRLEKDQLIEDIKSRIARTQALLQNIDKVIRERLLGGGVPSLSLDTRVLQIDDQAEEGWKEIFQYMIYGMKTDDIFRVMRFNPSLSPSEPIQQKIDGIFHNLKGIIESTNETPTFDPDVILLDVRLLPDYDAGMQHDIERMSGSLLLKRIRNEYPGIPVIATTASNKVWTYQQLIKLGADGYWIKEGLDEQRTAEESVENYIKFLELIAIVSGEKYAFLRTIAGEMKRLFDPAVSRKFWWEEKDWGFEYVFIDGQGKENVLIPKVTKVGRDTIKEILTDALGLIRQYYQVTLMGHGYNLWTEKEWYLASQAIQHLSNIIEVIHDFESIRKNARPHGQHLRYLLYDKFETVDGFFDRVNRGYKFKRRGDEKGGDLLEVRNKASHYAGAKLLGTHHLRKYFKDVLHYLENEPVVSKELVRRYERNKKVYADKECKHETER